MCTTCNQNNCGGCTQEINICNQCVSEQPCDCAVKDLSTDCSVYNQDNIECNSVVVIAKNTILSEALSNIVSWSCTKFTELATYLRIINVGTGASIYAGDNLIGEKKLRKLKSTDNSVIITQGTDDINFTTTVYDGSETKIANGTNTTVVGTGTIASPYQVNSLNSTYSNLNIGTGAQIYKDSTVVGSNTQFNLRKIKSSNASLTVTEETNDVDLNLTVDTVPTDGSINPITSNAVFDALSGGVAESKYETIVVALSDLITNITTGVNKAYFRIPFTATITSVRASVLVAQTAGSILTFDINEGGTSILSTKLTIDNNEKTSVTAITPPVVSDAILTEDSEITFDIDQVGTAGAKGAVITLIVTRA